MTVTLDDVADWLKVPRARLDEATGGQALAAALAHVAKNYTTPDDTDAADAADWRLGVVMLVARLARRADSPVGTIGFDEFSASVARYDPDIQALLGPYEVVRFG
jgi:hypothetical protein